MEIDLGFLGYMISSPFFYIHFILFFILLTVALIFLCIRFINTLYTEKWLKFTLITYALSMTVFMLFL
ncbi:hypothetical protein, partial [Chryseobacterium sp.]|uniref:hypothetical protein n=1 Tax=Chryseobacterium sp. TaxID=1871047 RepID=UPI0025B96F9F